jgi:hypothetical protein
MDINRRIALKNLLIIAASTAILPSCFNNEGKASIQLKNISINSDQEKLLAEFGETIIPKTDSPGAKEIGAHLFALKLLDDCSTKEEQESFEKGLKAFEKFANDKFDRPFFQCSEGQKQEILRSIENKKDISEDVANFYSMMKELTIDSYITSKYYLTEVRPYELVPGRFKGCVPANA